jgi:hypothetical protein
MHFVAVSVRELHRVIDDDIPSFLDHAAICRIVFPGPAAC